MFHALKPNIEFYGQVIIIFGVIMIFVKQSSAVVFCSDLYELLLYLSRWLISARDIYAAKHNWVLSFVFILEMSMEKNNEQLFWLLLTKILNQELHLIFSIGFSNTNLFFFF